MRRRLRNLWASVSGQQKANVLLAALVPICLGPLGLVLPSILPEVLGVAVAVVLAFRMIMHERAIASQHVDQQVKAATYAVRRELGQDIAREGARLQHQVNNIYETLQTVSDELGLTKTVAGSARISSGQSQVRANGTSHKPPWRTRIGNWFRRQPRTWRRRMLGTPG